MHKSSNYNNISNSRSNQCFKPSLKRIYLFVSFILIIFILFNTIHTSDTAEASVKRPQRWVTKESALIFLTKEMSKMEDFKSNILKPIVIERVSGSDGNKLVQKHIVSMLKTLDWHIEEDRFTDVTPYGQKEFTNIIATYDPSKPVKVVLACHFDSKYFTDFKFVAATDSAVPCAILLETARQLDCLMKKGPKEASSAKDITLQLLFLDGEEAFKQWTSTDSIYGARHLAQRWEKEQKLSSIREFILLDLIGTSDTHFARQFSETKELYANLVKIESLLGEKGLLTVKRSSPIFTERENWGGIEDDHIPFMERGVEVLHLISSPFPSVWHNVKDDWDHLDFNLIDDFSRIFRVFVSNLLHLQPEERSCRKKC
ncbi:glutaminyl-peptide cyclotransferase-like isoform X2 [Physella acuta]|uniref:glutaminyl-peptide cyclotransferase-like isoform X2 n=1 Tax=Physella acuta TaxID=109671 RepID=UPI0027DC58E1|nr:glutaminyl-peptide cyclotransferase-like isoform X2 [Physella acuta]XP_059172561.1 glutaminyl-peptide cyclotransferase-like isoform X2 [Physella acuta]